MIETLKLLRDPTFPTNKKRAAEFVRRGHGSERTFYNKLKELGGADNIAAQLHAPVAGCKSASDFKLAPSEPPALRQDTRSQTIRARDELNQGTKPEGSSER